jgi:hypothetical protein
MFSTDLQIFDLRTLLKIEHSMIRSVLADVLYRVPGSINFVLEPMNEYNWPPEPVTVIESH